MNICIEQCVRAVSRPLSAGTSHVPVVAAMFGLGLDATREIIVVPPTCIELKSHQIVFITGPSGGGKSTLLRLICDALGQRGSVASHAAPCVIDFDHLPDLPEAPLVDCFDQEPLDEVMRLLSTAGLSEAFVLLRHPDQLSDGQRWRLRLAQAMRLAHDAHDHAEACEPKAIMLADEFGATLDRVAAKVLARKVRQWVWRERVCFVAATTHDDLLETLEPDVLVVKHLGERMEVMTRGQSANAVNHQDTKDTKKRI